MMVHMATVQDKFHTAGKYNGATAARYVLIIICIWPHCEL